MSRDVNKVKTRSFGRYTLSCIVGKPSLPSWNRPRARRGQQKIQEKSKHWHAMTSSTRMWWKLVGMFLTIWLSKSCALFGVYFKNTSNTSQWVDTIWEIARKPYLWEVWVQNNKTEMLEFQAQSKYIYSVSVNVVKRTRSSVTSQYLHF